jgi:nicotinamidase-related amidase
MKTYRQMHKYAMVILYNEEDEGMIKNQQALLVIDVQNEYFTGLLPVTYPEGSRENILKAMDHAARVGIPVAIIQHTAPSKDSPTFRKGSEGWKLHPEVEKRKCDILIEKNLPGSFTGTELETWLRARDIERVAACGCMAYMCCDTTAHQAFHLGFQVDFLSDATGTLSLQNSAGAVSDCDLHRAVLVTMAMRFARVMETEEWVAVTATE